MHVRLLFTSLLLSLVVGCGSSPNPPAAGEMQLDTIRVASCAEAPDPKLCEKVQKILDLTREAERDLREMRNYTDSLATSYSSNPQPPKSYEVYPDSDPAPRRLPVDPYLVHRPDAE